LQNLNPALTQLADFLRIDNEKLQRFHDEMIQKVSSTITNLRRFPLNANFRPEYILGAQSFFNLYIPFRRKMEEEEIEKPKKMNPRKVAKCPKSQFNLGGNFQKTDYQTETFRFIGSDNVPYTKNGRGYNNLGNEEQIKELKNWRAKPLPPIGG
jgi:hypothetical protein